MARARMGSPIHTIVRGRPTSTNTTRTKNQKIPSGILVSRNSVASATRTRRRPRGVLLRLGASFTVRVFSVLLMTFLLSL
jgi:hypothetical protein